MKKAVCLLSGGLDSCVVATIAKKELGYDLYCLTVKYGQRHSKEIESAKIVANKLGAKEHIILDVDLGKLCKISSLIDKNKRLEERSMEEIGNSIPSTYVPARNIIFLSLALAYAENIGADARKKACGKCDSCLLRLKGFKEAGYKDPIEYESLPDWYIRD